MASEIKPLDRGKVIKGESRDSPASLSGRVTVPITGKSKEKIKKGCCRKVSDKILKTYREEPDKLVFLQRAFGVAAGVCSSVKLSGTSSTLKLIPPFFIWPHDYTRVKNRFAMAKTAAKVGQKAEVLFNTVKIIDAGADLLSSVSSISSWAMKLSGYAQMGIIAVIFTVVLPKFFLATTILGVSGDFWGLLRSISAYREFCKRKGNEDFRSLIDALEFIKGGSNAHLPETTVAQKKLKEFTKTVHQQTCFRGSKTAFREAQIDKLFEKIKTAVNQERVFIQGIDQEIVKSATTAITQAFNSDLKSKDALFALQTCHQQILQAIKNNPGFKDSPMAQQIEEHIQIFRKLMQEAKEINRDAESEMRRVILNNIIVVLIDLLFLASTITSNSSSSQQNQEDANIWSLTACLLQMSHILFDNKVSDEQYKKLENLFLKKPPITET